MKYCLAWKITHADPCIEPDYFNIVNVQQILLNFLDFSLTGMMGSGLELWPKRRDNEGAKIVSKGNTVQLQPLTKRPSPRN